MSRRMLKNVEAIESTLKTDGNVGEVFRKWETCWRMRRMYSFGRILEKR
jgi:hypothetical protein